MKKFFQENWLWILLAMLIAGSIVSIILNIFWLKKVLLAPFAVLGFYSALSGFGSIVNNIVDDREDSIIKGGLTLTTFCLALYGIAMWITEW